KRHRAPNATGHRHIDVCALWEPRCPWQPPTKNGAIHVPRATFWHGGLRKDKWECLMNACFYGSSGIAALGSDLRNSLAVHLLDHGRLCAADDPSTSPYAANALLPMSDSQ